MAATELRSGTVFKHEGTVWRVLEYKHTHLSRRAADIKVRVKDLVKGTVRWLTVGPSEKFEEAQIERRRLQFLYQDGEGFYFMDPQSFEQLSLGKEQLKEEGRFLKEGEVYEVFFWEGKPLGVELPAAVVLTVKETGPGEKGDSAVNIYKPAVLENGLKVKVPLFIKTGDKIKVDTRTGEYLARAK